MVQRVGGARDESKPKQKTKHPKQNGFKPGRWVGLDPFAPSHNKEQKTVTQHSKNKIAKFEKKLRY